MSGAHRYNLGGDPGPGLARRFGARTDGARIIPAGTPANDEASAASDVFGEVADASRLRAISAEWRGLIARCAEPNPFMEPAVAEATAAATGMTLHVLLAWRRAGAGAPDLVGVWLLAQNRPSSRLPLRVLACPINSLTFLGTPVVDRSCMVEAISAMLAGIAASPHLPKVLCASDIAADGVVLPALRAALARRGTQPLEIERRSRAKLDMAAEHLAEADRSQSQKHRSELRRRRRKLTESGALAHVSHRSPDEVGAAFREFLQLEAAGWKGQSSAGGRAVLKTAPLAMFAERMIEGLARDGCAGIDALRLDGRPIAMNVWLRSGSGVFGWKMAYDEAYRRSSPGTLLLEDLVRSFSRDPTVRFIDSCNRNDETALAHIWSGRRVVVDLIIDVRRGGSWTGRWVAATEYAFRQARKYGREIYHAARRRRRPQRTAAAAGTNG
ncbi:GNAT family N-acetyltransferase [Methylobacterium oryzisoli]|uniref:GNAT family N-acetyltransferase n=1 Tax=Methylobacterium oryzisoli TaxID=3385502 RepID=UPI003891C811